MKFLRAFSLFIALVGMITLVTTFVTEKKFADLAKVYQLVEPTEESALFGGIGNKIGSPQEYIITHEAAIMEETDENGNQYVNNKTLKENNVYPLQMKSVRESALIAKVGSVSALVLGGLLAWFASRKLSAKTQ